jgi:hypothetical protein
MIYAVFMCIALTGMCQPMPDMAFPDLGTRAGCIHAAQWLNKQVVEGHGPNSGITYRCMGKPSWGDVQP